MSQRILVRRTMPLKMRDAAKSSDGQRGRFQAYGDVWGVVNKYYKELSVAGSYKKTLREGGKKVPLNKDHDTQIGYLENAREDDYGLAFDGAVNLKTEAGNDAWELTLQSIENDSPMGVSREVYIIKDQINGKDIREILEQQLVGMALTPYQSLRPALVTNLRDIQDALRGIGVTLTPELEEALALGRDAQAADEDAEALAIVQAATPDYAAFREALSARSIQLARFQIGA